MEDLLIETLETFGIPVLLQGSLGEAEAYPDRFFTFWNNDSFDGSYYDNQAVSTVYDFDVNCYSTDPAQVSALLLQAKQRLRGVGFLISGKGHSVVSDEPTHTGRGMSVLYLENGG